MTQGSTLSRWIRAGVATGIVDWLFATFLSGVVYRTGVTRLWQGVASVALGPDAIGGGSRTVLIGILMHFGVAFTWSAVFLFLLMRWGRVREVLDSPWGVLKIAAVWGPFIWMVMSLLVIPAFTGRMPALTARWWVNFFGHIPFVAMPMLWAIRRSGPVEFSRSG
jgi:hypothetical protein